MRQVSAEKIGVDTGRYGSEPTVCTLRRISLFIDVIAGNQETMRKAVKLNKYTEDKLKYNQEEVTMTVQDTKEILKTLDELYGTTKTGFLHDEDWQLLAAIMLSAQSTDK